MKKYLLLLLLLASCTKNDDTPTVSSIPINYTMSLRVETTKGIDLLSDDNPLSLNKKLIRVTYLSVDGTEMSFFESFLDTFKQSTEEFDLLVKANKINPNGCVFNNPRLVINLFPDRNAPYVDGKYKKTYKTLLHWNDNIVDTIEAWFWIYDEKRVDGRCIDKEILLNGKPIWQGDKDNLLYDMELKTPIRVFDEQDLK